MVEVRAGPVTARFDPFTAQLRYVFFGDCEAVRGIYCAVRDCNWGTILPALSDLEIDQQEESFEITFTAHHRRDEIDFHWRGAIRGDSNGTIRFECDGEALSPFETRRTGVCVLHPNRAVAGAPVTVEHGDGSVTQGEFPRLVSPDSPFYDVRKIRHAVSGGSVEITLEGETFEMEDQRNWSDDSFKTYCRPQEWPQPFRLAPGEPVRHTVTLRFSSAADAASGAPRSLELDRGRSYPIPSIGTRASAGGSGISWGHLLRDVGDFGLLESPDWRAVLVYAEAKVPEARSTWPGAPVLLATHSNFTELNRSRPAGQMDGVAFAMNAQVHALDTATAMESVAAQRSCLDTARSFSPGPVHVGPVSIDSSGRDPRHGSLAAAAFVLGSVASLVGGEPDSLTYFSDDVVAVSPARAVFEDLLEFAAGEAFEARAAGFAEPYPSVFALGLRVGAREALLLANATPEEVTIRLGLAGAVARILDETNVESGERTTLRLSDELRLGPHAYIRIDLGGKREFTAA
jgi:hypothetical protein